MLYVMLVIGGLVPLTMKGLVMAGVWQLASAEGLDWSLDRRDDKRHVASGGWRPLSDYPVVGEPGWQDKVNQLRRGNR